MLIDQISTSTVPRQLQLWIAKPDRTIIGSLKTSFNKILRLKYGQIDELEFEISVKVNPKHTSITNSVITHLKERYMVKAVLGSSTTWFKIIKVTKEMNDDSDIYKVLAYSLPYELSDKKIKSLEISSTPATAALTECLSNTLWSIGTVSSTFDTMYRSFDLSSLSRLDFLFKIAESYGGIIQFNTTNRTVSLYKKSEIGSNKGLKFKYGKYLQQISNDSNSDELVTRLYAYGSDNLSIQRLSPQGVPYVDDFQFFLYPYSEDELGNKIASSNYMSDSLASAILSYNTLLATKEPTEDTAEVGTTTTNLRLTAHGLVSGDYIVNETRGNEIREVTYVDADNITVTAIDEQTSGDTINKYLSGTFGKLAFSKSDLQIDLTALENELTSLNTEKQIILNILALQTELGTYTPYNFSYAGSPITKTTTISNSYKYAVMCKVSATPNLTIELDSVSKTLSPNTWTVLGKIQNATSTSVEFSGSATGVSVQLIVVKITDVEYSTIGNESVLINEYCLDNKETEITAKEAEIDSVEADIESVDSSITSMQSDLSYANNFTSAQLEELNQFIIEYEWLDDNYVDDWELWNDAKAKLAELNEPPILIDIDVVNFLECLSEQHNWDKLVLGDTITVEVEQLNIDTQAQIIEIEYNFESGDIKLIISNFKQKETEEQKIINAFYKAISTGDTLDNKKFDWDLVKSKFNNRTQQYSTVPSTPTIATDGSALDYVQNTDSSVNIIFKWSYNDYEDTQAEADYIDGFYLYFYSSATNDIHTFGSTISREAMYVIEKDKRTYTFPSVSADRYYTIGIQAWRYVDKNIHAIGKLKSAIVKPSITSENPYQPMTDINYTGNVAGVASDSISKTPATVIVGVEGSSANIKRADYVVSNGSTSAEDTINTAIQAIPGTTHDRKGKLVILEGEYIVDGSIICPSNLEIEMSAGTIIKIKNSLNSDLDVFVNSDIINGNSNINIASGVLDGNYSNNASGIMHGIKFTKVIESNITNVNIKNYSNYGIYFISSHANTLLENKFNNNYIGLFFSSCNNNTINSNIFQSNLWNGFSFTGCNNNTIVSNVLKSNSGNGFVSGTSIGNTFQGNISESNGGSGFMLFDTISSSIINNICKLNSYYGIVISSSSHNDVSGNQSIENSQGTNNTYDNIYITDNSDYNNLQSNVCRRGSLTNQSRYGIRINSSDCNSNIVTNNDLYTSGVSGSFSDGGSSTVSSAGNRL